MTTISITIPDWLGVGLLVLLGIVAALALLSCLLNLKILGMERERRQMNHRLDQISRRVYGIGRETS